MGSNNQQQPTPPADETPSVPTQQSLTLFTAQAEEGIRRVWLDDQWYFSIIDVIAVLTDSASPRIYWGKLKERMQDEGFLEVMAKCRPLKLTAPDGKQRETDCADFATMVSLMYLLPALRRRADCDQLNPSAFPDSCGIYAIVNTVTQEHYIGSSTDFASRFLQHKALLRRGKHHAPRLQEAWDTYGEEAFQFVILERLGTNGQLEEIEQRYIDEAQPVYNAAKVARNRLSLPTAIEERIEQVIRYLYNVQGFTTQTPVFRALREAVTYGLIRPGPKFDILVWAEASGVETWEAVSAFIEHYQPTR